MSTVPANKQLYSEVSARASEIFKSNRGIYRSAWIVREYKRLGGTYVGKAPTSTDPGLRRWFKEKWVDLNRPIYGVNREIIGYEQCGRSDATKGIYPLCRPMYRVTDGTPLTVAELSAASISSAKKAKAKVRGDRNVRF